MLRGGHCISLWCGGRSKIYQNHASILEKMINRLCRTPIRGRLSLAAQPQLATGRDKNKILNVNKAAYAKLLELLPAGR